MEFFLDTAIVEEIRAAGETGLLGGVTTNPSHIAASGKPFERVVREILDIVDGPVSVEVVSTDVKGMIEEARRIAKMAVNVVVKIPSTKAGITAMGHLNKEGVPVNATLCFSPLQALLVAKAGAAYVSPFIGRLDDVGHDGMQLVEEIRTMYDNYAFETRILAAAVRHPRHVLQSALAGAEVATMRYGIFEQLFQHPMTDTGLAQFLEDWKKVPHE